MLIRPNATIMKNIISNGISVPSIIVKQSIMENTFVFGDHVKLICHKLLKNNQIPQLNYFNIINRFNLLFLYEPAIA